MYLITNSSIANELDKSSIEAFIKKMSIEHGYDKEKLKNIFDKTRYSKKVLNAISRPAEALPWYKYREIFLQDDRINQGVKFWDEHQDTLIAAEDKYGVPPYIIVAIIGVETRYGKNTGNDKVMDALSTLAFHYPKRSEFFKNELEQFLLLSSEQKIDPLSISGSYAGAMGIPQFIPSSYRNYAVDFDNDGFIDIWKNPVDAIGSVANYFSEHGWNKGQQVIIIASKLKDTNIKIEDDGLKPDLDIDEIKQFGLVPSTEIPRETKIKPLVFKNRTNEEVWLGMENFYVITRYNHSKLYAMAVFQLSEKIKDKFLSKKPANN